MGIIKFSPISEPKRIKDAAGLRELPNEKKVLIGAEITATRAQETK